MATIISSVDNPAIKHIVKLHSSKGRREFGQFLVEGIRACSAFSQASKLPVHCYTTNAMAEEVAQLFPASPIIYVSEAVMKKISTATTPSGIIAVFAIPTPELPTTLSKGLVCAEIQDPGNMGTLIRTAAAFAYDAVFIVEGTDAWSPKVVQASAGALAQIPVYTVNWQELVHFARHQQLTLCALVVKDGKNPEKINFTNTLLVVGNEAHGLRSEWQKDCQEFMTLPMPGNTESLNAATAGALALYCGYISKLKNIK